MSLPTIHRRRLVARLITIAVMSGLTVAATSSGSAAAAPWFVGVNVSTLSYSSAPSYVNEPPSSYTTLYGGGNNGIKRIRFTTDWDNWQPTLAGPLDSAYTNRVATQVGYMKAAGLQTVIDIHNFNPSEARAASKFGKAGGPTAAHFRDFWTKVATAFKNEPNVVAFDLINEPNSGVNVPYYKNATQEAFDGIRSQDTDVEVWVESPVDWSNVVSWTNTLVGAPWIQNTAHTATATYASDKVVYSAHTYPTWGGTFPNGCYTIACDQADWDSWPNRVQVFINWLKAYPGQMGSIGETGWANELQVNATEQAAQTTRVRNVFTTLKNSGVIIGVLGWEATSAYYDQWNMADSPNAAYTNPTPGISRLHKQFDVFRAFPSDGLPAAPSATINATASSGNISVTGTKFPADANVVITLKAGSNNQSTTKRASSTGSVSTTFRISRNYHGSVVVTGTSGAVIATKTIQV